MTWGELKRNVEAVGVKDDTPIWYIDMTGLYPVEELHIKIDDKKGLEVW